MDIQSIGPAARGESEPESELDSEPQGGADPRADPFYDPFGPQDAAPPAEPYQPEPYQGPTFSRRGRSSRRSEPDGTGSTRRSARQRGCSVDSTSSAGLQELGEMSLSV